MERFKLSEKCFCKEHRMAWTTAVRDAHSRRLQVPPSLDHGSDDLDLYLRLITQDQHSRLCFCIECFQSRADGGCTAFVEIGRLHKSGPFKSHPPPYLLSLMPHHYDHLIQEGHLCLSYHPFQESRAAPREKLFGLLPQPTRGSSSENETRHKIAHVCASLARYFCGSFVKLFLQCVLQK